MVKSDEKGKKIGREREGQEEESEEKGRARKRIVRSDGKVPRWIEPKNDGAGEAKRKKWRGKGGDFRCSGEMRRDLKEYRWRRRPPGQILTLRCETKKRK